MDRSDAAARDADRPWGRPRPDQAVGYGQVPAPDPIDAGRFGNYSVVTLVTGEFPCAAAPTAQPTVAPHAHKKSDRASSTTASLFVGALALALALA